MKIVDVIDESILAIFRDPVLSRSLVLKGGGAIRLLDHERSRLSLDADFSLRGSITREVAYFSRLERSLSRRFALLGYSVLDFKTRRKPTHRKPDLPRWWSGWLCQFKLVATKYSKLSLETRQRHALIPEGSNSSVIEIEISEHEYCGSERTKKVRGIVVHGYTRELLVVEKLRAICQQHPAYKFRSNKNRARDFYDIRKLCHGTDRTFFRRCRRQLVAVFAAKEVPLSLLLKAFWDEEFLAGQRRGFAQVVDSTVGTLDEFDVYLEYVRYLVKQIHPDVPPAPTIADGAKAD